MGGSDWTRDEGHDLVVRREGPLLGLQANVNKLYERNITSSELTAALRTLHRKVGTMSSFGGK